MLIYVILYPFLAATERRETGPVTNYHFHGPINTVGNVGGDGNTSRIGKELLWLKVNTYRFLQILGAPQRTLDDSLERRKTFLKTKMTT